MSREYPAAPIVAVGVVLLDGDRVLLIERRRDPGAGLWTVPGGGVNVGESLREAALRELEEETGLTAALGPVVEVLERIVSDRVDPSRTRYHYVIVDFLATEPRGKLRAASDAGRAEWVPIADLPRFRTTDNLAPVIERACALRDGKPLPPYAPDAPLRK